MAGAHTLNKGGGKAKPQMVESGHSLETGPSRGRLRGSPAMSSEPTAHRWTLLRDGAGRMGLSSGMSVPSAFFAGLPLSLSFCRHLGWLLDKFGRDLGTWLMAPDQGSIRYLTVWGIRSILPFAARVGGDFSPQW